MNVHDSLLSIGTVNSNLLSEINKIITVRDYMMTVAGDARVVPNEIRKEFDKLKSDIDKLLVSMLLNPKLSIFVKDTKENFDKHKQLILAGNED